MNLVLAVITLAYMVRGFQFLVRSPKGAGDLHLRWVDIQYVLAGRNPFDVYFADPVNHIPQVPPYASNRDSRPLPEIGYAKGVSYPQWAYFGGIIFFWPPWPAVRIYWAVFNMAALAVTFWWAFKIGREHGRSVGLLFGLSCLAIGANCTVLGQGQYGLVIDAFLILSMICQQRNRSVPEGVFMGLAIAKPNVAGLFMLPMLVRRRWTAVLSTVVYISIASAVIWLLVKTNPLVMGHQWLLATQDFRADINIVIDPLLAIGLKMSMVSKLVAAVGGLAALAGIYAWRHASSLVQFAIASVVGRFWAYHRNYDDVMLAFLLVALAVAAFNTRKTWLMLAFLLVATALWAPARFYDHAACTIYLQLICLAGLAALLVATPRAEPAGSGSAGIHDKSRAD